MTTRGAKRGKVSGSTSLQAPVGGLNAKDAFAAMKPSEAVVLDNFFPTASSVDLRRGMVNHLTSVPAGVETLMGYQGGSTWKLFAAASTAIYDATTAGVAGSAVVSGLTNARWQHVQMGTAGGQFLLAVNGADKMRIFNGTSWSFDGGSHTVTGFDTANAEHINTFKSRLFFIEKQSMSAWYLPVSSIGGNADELDLSSIFQLGGYLMAMANWTLDNAAGVDDYAVFVTSEGEVAVYKGTNPGSATDWALVGTFKMGKPIGRRCFCKAGADVLFITQDGAFPLSKALLTDRSQLNLAASDKISRLLNTDIQQYGSNFGWQPIIYPLGQKLLINVPQVTGTTAVQYVMNTETRAWCRFTGWNANCFETVNNRLFYGDANSVKEADTGFSDNGGVINAVAQQAFNYFGRPGLLKHFKQIRAVFLSDADINPLIGMNVDFQIMPISGSSSYAGGGGTAWDDGDWDTFDWAGGLTITQRWLGVSEIGYAGSVRVEISIQGGQVQWQATDILYEVGQTL